MKLKKAVKLCEDIEIGIKDGKTIAKKKPDNSISMDYDAKGYKVQYVDNLNPIQFKAVKQIYNYLKANNKEKFISQWDTKTPDINFASDGTAIVNFDDGGTIRVPENIYSKY